MGIIANTSLLGLVGRGALPFEEDFSDTSNWTVVSGSLTSDGSVASIKAGGAFETIASLDVAIPGDVECELLGNNFLGAGFASAVGVLIRCQDVNNWIGLALVTTGTTPDTWGLFKKEAGVFTQWGVDILVDLGTNQTLKITRQGNTYSAEVDGVSSGSFEDVGDFLLSNENICLRGFTSGAGVTAGNYDNMTISQI